MSENSDTQSEAISRRMRHLIGKSSISIALKGPGNRACMIDFVSAYVRDLQ